MCARRSKDRLPEDSDRGKALAGKSTLNRLELGKKEGPDKYHKILPHEDQIDTWMVDGFIRAHEYAPDEIVLDLDATEDLIHGNQEGRFFHGYYGNHCYLPLYIFSGEHRLDYDSTTMGIDRFTRSTTRANSWPCSELKAPIECAKVS